MNRPIDARDMAIRAMSRLPADASLEDIREEFEVVFGILAGLRDCEEGRTISHEEVMEGLRQWRQKSAGLPVQSTN
jgi:predicted transcriptional regulator